jgi:hypothetical protein
MFNCDSGDIYPKEYEYNRGITVSATFVFDNLNAFPDDYPVIFGAFNDKQSTPLASVRIMKPRNTSTVQVAINNLDHSTTSVILCLANLGREPVYTLFETDVDLASDSIVIPATEISLADYDRIQNLVFEQYTCVACHQGSAGAGNLLLTADRSYDDLVDKASSVNTAKNRVTPSDIDNSFLLDVLQDENLSLTQPHTGFVTRDDDIILLKEWIKDGCRR